MKITHTIFYLMKIDTARLVYESDHMRLRVKFQFNVQGEPDINKIRACEDAIRKILETHSVTDFGYRLSQTVDSYVH